ncbi:hypothetical protein EDB95_4930 [Dinghuibacter silviterrae]|uniref:Uncharacterized protein n=2 Tax=Dinghuibacter silviterrae TaxID=1539049 RepID=A0A4R8DJB1_9BACT|nr:hypothetical protein EDB95_4930 [Dinghuibacter silviterrae]
MQAPVIRWGLIQKPIRDDLIGVEWAYIVKHLSEDIFEVRLIATISGIEAEEWTAQRKFFDVDVQFRESMLLSYEGKPLAGHLQEKRESCKRLVVRQKVRIPANKCHWIEGIIRWSIGTDQEDEMAMTERAHFSISLNSETIVARSPRKTNAL